MPIKNKKLSSTILAALGLGATACGPCLDMAVCLSFKPDSDTGGGNDDTGTGPCLSTDPGDSDSYVGPCLDVPPDTDTGCDSGDSGCGDTAETGDTADTGRAVRAGALAGAVTEVLERSVLPEDVVARIRARRQGF